MNTTDILWFLAIGAFFIFMMRKGGGCCGGGHGDNNGHGDHAGHEGHSCGSDSHDKHKEDHPAAKVGQKDPVCGMDVAEDAQGGARDSPYTPYHFCSEPGKKQSDREPETYVY